MLIVESAAADTWHDDLHRAGFQSITGRVQFERCANFVRTCPAFWNGKDASADYHILFVQKVQRVQAVSKIGVDEAALQT